MSDDAKGSEIDHIYVSFGGEGSGYDEMMDGAVDKTTKSSKDMVNVLNNAAKQIEKEFRAQAKTFSMTAREAEIFRLQLAGATDEQVAGARAANDALTALEKEQKEFEQFVALETDVKSFTASLQAQSRTFGMNARQVEIYRLAMAGASKADLMHLQALDRKLTKMEKQNALMEKGKSVTNQFRTATEIFTQRQKELNEMLDQGAIDAATYARAIDDAKKKLGTGWDRIAEAMNPTNTALMAIGRNIQQIGRSYSMYVTAPIVAFGALGTREFAKFNNAMTEGFAIMGDIDDAMKNRLSKTVRDMSAGRKTKFAPDELADGLKNLAAAGLTAEQSMQSLGVVERFATAGAFGLQRASSLLLDSQAALGMVEKDAVKNRENLLKVSDALIMSGAQSTGEPEQFAEALANGAADARMFGMELSTTMAVLNAYAKSGNKGASAGSDLARATRLISKAVRENGEVFTKMGIEPIDKATGEYKNFIDIVGQMEKAFVGLTGPERAAMLELMGFEALAQSAILPLIGMFDLMKIWEKGQKNATDYTKNTAEKQMKSFTNEMLALWSQIKEVGIEIGSHLVPTLKMLGNTLSSTLTFWRNLPGPIKGVTIGIAGLVAAIGPLLVVFGSAIVAIAALKTSLATLGLAGYASALGIRSLNMAMAATPWGIAIAAGVALGVAFDQFIGEGAIWTAQLNQQLKIADELTNKLSKVQSGRTKSQLKEFDAIEDPNKKRAEIQGALDRERKSVEGLSSMVRTCRAELDEMNNSWAAMVGWKMIAVQESELKGLEANLETTRDRTVKLEEALAAMGTAGLPAVENVAKAIKPIDIELNELTNKLQEQLATFKNSTEEAKIYELRMAGLTEAQLANVVALNEQLKAKKQEQKHREAMSKFDDDLINLKAEEEAYGKGARAVEIYKMQLRGASSAQIEQARAIDTKLTAMENEKKARDKIASFKDDVLKMEAEAATFGKGARAAEIYRMRLSGASEAQIAMAESLDKTLTKLEKQKKLQEKADEVLKKHGPPAERFKKEQAELQDMLDAGLITLETYKKGLIDVWREMAKDYKIEFRVGGVDAVAAGSADAIARAQEFLAMRDQTGKPKKIPKAKAAKGVHTLTDNPFKPGKPQKLAKGKKAADEIPGFANPVLPDFNIPTVDPFAGAGTWMTGGGENKYADNGAPIPVPTTESWGHKLAREAAEQARQQQANQPAGGTSSAGGDGMKDLLTKIETNTRKDSSTPTVIFKPGEVKRR